ncbi:nicotianamine synthase family protein [Methanosarcina sp. 2.H.A.1B.4]|uniref:nicotianamine synthase family protein n=1 Tax=Methanosarcina sp. 2.H.A.1B.4 TaxID=1483600 RepID=UPI00062270BE|nr:nicotianamine synthase family protein [Methanosarcina sp. 2.H.A.1B.4]KKG13150.1 methyltransferase [Methanosarcina sp. 2.H.A.1B.4]
MNSLLSAEDNNFPFKFQEYEPQLYDIRSHILHFYSNIKDLDLSTKAEANLSDLYEIFSELDELGHRDVAEDLCQALLRDPLIRSLLPAVYTSYTHFFSLHETHLARKILDCKEPWEMLESFPLYSRYEDMIKTHVQNSPKIEVLAFIGCGPLPVTLLIFSKLYGIRCIGVDKDPEAVVLAKSCVKHFGLEKEISIVEGDENTLAELDWDSVLVAGLAEPKQRIFRNLHSIIKNRKSEPENPTSVCYRNYSGMRQLLYWPVQPDQTTGFRKITEIYPSGKVNNTLVFMECE